MLTLALGAPTGFAQQTAPGATDSAASELPTAPAPVLTEPLDLRPSQRDFSKPAARFWGNPINMFRPTTIPKASFANSVRLTDLVKDGKIYLSLSDAIALALENNYDIAIARYDLDIADTDILRTRTGAAPLGAPSGLVTGHAGRFDFDLDHGRRTGRNDGWLGRRGFRRRRIDADHGRRGPGAGERSIPSVTGTDSVRSRPQPPQTSFFSGGSSPNTNTVQLHLQPGICHRHASAGWLQQQPTPPTSNSTRYYSPQLSSSFKATVTQHLLQGAGIWVNKRFIYQALNDRRITDSSFRQQILYTVNQVETIYWGLVQAYEDVQAKERALDQSTKLLATTASSCRSAPWRRSMWSTPNPAWPPTSRR